MDAEGAAGRADPARRVDGEGARRADRSVEDLYERIHRWTLKHCSSSASGVVLVFYVAVVLAAASSRRRLLQTAIGFVTAFFDTLGIGSFATTTAVYKLRNMVPVKLIPGTLNVGHTLATIAQAFIYTKLVPVESTTLVLMIVGGVRRRLARRRRRRPLVAAQDSDRHGHRAAGRGGADADAGSSNLFPGGGDALGLSGVRLVARPGRQLRARRADDARHRPLRAVHDSGQPARHEPDRGVSDHDGIVRVPDAGRERRASCARGPITRRRRSGLALGGVPAVLIAAYLVRVAAARRGPLAGRRRRGLHVAEHAADGADRAGRAGQGGSARLQVGESHA